MNYDAIPHELRERPQWVLWRLEQRDGKPTKMPYRADGRHAKTTDASTWATFEAVANAVDHFDGIGYVFSADDPYTGIDLDELNADAGAIMLALDSYAEESVSGRGAHVIVRASLNGHPRNRKGPLEIYDAGRYFVMTGRHVHGTPTTIEDRQSELEAVLSEFLPAEIVTASHVLPIFPVDLDDQELIEKAKAKNAKFAALWDGDTSAHGDDDSAADSGLCAHLAWWTNRDPGRVDRLFRLSGLMRPKWDERRGEFTYGALTINHAIARCNGGYTPRESSRPGRDAVGTRSASTPEENAETAIASPRPDVVGTRDGTQSFSPGSVDVDLCFVQAQTFADEPEEGAAPLVGDDENVLVPEGANLMFYGDGGAGKTTLMIDLALHLAAGEDWLEVGVTRGVRVAIVENEGPRPLFRAKLRRKLAGWKGASLDDRLLTLQDPWSKVSLDDKCVRSALAARVRDEELDVIVMGPVTRSGMNEAGTLQHVRDFVNLLDDVRTASGRRVTFLLAHHENRGGAPSGAWEWAVDTLFHVQAQGNGQTRLYVQKARWSPKHHKQKFQLAWAEGESFVVIADEERDDNTIADEILVFVRAHGGTGWNKVEEAVSGKGGKLRELRDSLLAGGRLVNAGSPARMKLWHAADPGRPPSEGDEA